MSNCAECGKAVDTGVVVCRGCWEKRQWISVKDRLPEGFERWKRCAVTVVQSYTPVAIHNPEGPSRERCVKTAFYNPIQKIWHLDDDEGYINALIGSGNVHPNGDFVTHWMPMPEPPEEEQ